MTQKRRYFNLSLTMVSILYKPMQWIVRGCIYSIIAHSNILCFTPLPSFMHVSLYTVIACPVLQPPENGRVIQFGNAPGSVALYRCNEGYELQAGVSSTSTCGGDGQWTGAAPVCEGTKKNS